jgi:hypothetical protein
MGTVRPGWTMALVVYYNAVVPDVAFLTQLFYDYLAFSRAFNPDHGYFTKAHHIALD